MEPTYLLLLANLFAAHARRSLLTVAKRAGVHTRTFVQIQQGLHPRIDTFNRAYAWFDANWPSDLEWPRDIPRPSAAKAAKGRAA
jgi:hypothetical protein